MPKLPERIAEIGKKYGLQKDDLWDCQGTWVVYHHALERVAAEQGIEWEAPTVIAGNASEDVSMIVYGRLNGRLEWATGEASIDNYPKRGKAQRYPWAMAEKRGKDRVILKLIGLGGEVYSEEEAEDFKRGRVQDDGQVIPTVDFTPLDNTGMSNKELREVHGRLSRMLNNCNTMDDLKLWGSVNEAELDGLPEDIRADLRNLWKARRDELKAVV